MIEEPLKRSQIFPEGDLPDGADVMAHGRARAAEVRLGSCPFLEHHQVACEAAYKRRAMTDRQLMFHAQIGYRDPGKSREAYGTIHKAIAKSGGRVDRYGICLDWSMGYPAEQREGRPRGTGLILSRPEDFAALTRAAPVAPHFGDFVMGMPAALENTVAALQAGASAIGNLGQYFTFRLPGWEDDVGPTEATVEALALLAAQPQEILVHSNLDDGFAALFADLACSFGAVLIERYVVEDLIGGRIAHCYGHTFSEPLSRLAFQRAMAKMPGRWETPGSMVYGNTTLYRDAGVDNYGALASYLMVDLVAQHLAPTGHAVNPVPITEASRIPDIDEVVAAQQVGQRLAERAPDWAALMDLSAADRLAEQLIEGGQLFLERVLAGLAAADIDVRDPVQVLLALRRIGARRLEARFGPGAPEAGRSRRRPIVPTTEIRDLERQAQALAADLGDHDRAAIAQASLTACVCATDVHEYGKILIEETLRQLGVTVVDGGIHAEPDQVARLVGENNADLVAVSTYNGIALDYLAAVQGALAQEGLTPRVLIGGRLNQIPEDSNTSLPIDVTGDIDQLGAFACTRAADLLDHLLVLANSKNEKKTQDE